MEQWTGSCYLIILNDKFEVIDNIMNSLAFKILRMQNTMNWATLRFFAIVRHLWICAICRISTHLR